MTARLAGQMRDRQGQYPRLTNRQFPTFPSGNGIDGDGEFVRERLLCQLETLAGGFEFGGPGRVQI